MPSPSSAPLPPAVPHRPAAVPRRTRRRRRRRRMAAASSAVAPQSRWWASDIALWRPACASPTLSMRALPGRTPCGRHLNTPSEPARGSLLPPPPPPAWGAAAPSSLCRRSDHERLTKSCPASDFPNFGKSSARRRIECPSNRGHDRGHSQSPPARVASAPQLVQFQFAAPGGC
eukprot:COSAG03_NODE_1631_length_3742_cov_34.686334_5_plen_174_part_00